MEILDIEQRSPEWYAYKLGNFSPSEYHKLLTDPKSKADKDAGNLSEGALTYVHEKASEIITGLPARDDFENKYVAWGREWEPVAKKYYEKVFKCSVELVGGISNGDDSGSPDGLTGTIDDAGGIEIKCPYKLANHLKYLLLQSANDLKSKHKEYYWQCVGYMYLSGRKWWDFVAFHPSYPGALKLQVLKIHRNEDDIQLLTSKLDMAKKELNRIVTLLDK